MAVAKPAGKGATEDLSLDAAASHLLEECRMVLPGIQALFGFQLIAVFNQGFGEKLSHGAQLDGIVLVAKPGLPDPNFSETVVLVTHTDEGNPVGVILNRPTNLKLAEVAPRVRGAQNFTEPLYSGGPVMREVLVALFRADA